jgi:hypothetical protein
VLCFYSLNFKEFHITLRCKEDVDAGKYPIATTIINLDIITFIALLINNTKNRRPRRASSTNASGITLRLVCIFFTHTTRGNGGVENLNL